jgi:cytochrome c-type biogenesis protein CcmH/NrfF
VTWRFLAVAAAALAFAGPAAACAHPRTSQSFLEGQVMCPTCHTTLDMSDSQAAQQIKTFIARRIALCWTSQQIESALVKNFGQAILAEPSHSGFDLLAWWLPIAGVLVGAIILAFGVWRWSRGRDDEPPAAAASGLDDETERKIDELLADMD